LESVTLKSIQAARVRIGEAIYTSPCQQSSDLSELTGLPLHLKLENLQRTGSFKERGALNKLLTLSLAEREQGVITASAGNHAQGVAFHAANLGIRAQIVMPLATPPDQGWSHARLWRRGLPPWRQLRRSLRRGSAHLPRREPHFHSPLRRR
jgi:threonine dehydratase